MHSRLLSWAKSFLSHSYESYLNIPSELAYQGPLNAYSKPLYCAVRMNCDWSMRSQQGPVWYTLSTRKAHYHTFFIRYKQPEIDNVFCSFIRAQMCGCLNVVYSNKGWLPPVKISVNVSKQVEDEMISKRHKVKNMTLSFHSLMYQIILFVFFIHFWVKNWKLFWYVLCKQTQHLQYTTYFDLCAWHRI